MKSTLLLTTAIVLALPMAAYAQDDTTGSNYSLGDVTVWTAGPKGDAIGGASISQEQIQLLNLEKLDAAIDSVPGTSVSIVGARNETDVWIRGFDRWRMLLTIDGIPIYLPADNRIDFSRFTTSDVAEIQISKGFTSVIDGPGAMGGAINLVSRQVTKPFEGEARLGAGFDQNGAFNGVVADFFTGVRQEKWYVQASGTENYQNHFRLSDDFVPATLENGGNRNRSYAQDSKINLKAGYLPSNSDDEYSINFVDQLGAKNNPLADTKAPTAAAANGARFWDWPAWDKQSVYFISKTALDDAGSYVKVRAFYDRFYNELFAYDNINFNTQTLPKAFDSYYDDHALGANIELAEILWDGKDVLKFAGHFRYDEHTKWQKFNEAGIVGTLPFTEPHRNDDENLYSIAVENTLHPITAVDLIAGLSYDRRDNTLAQDFLDGSGGKLGTPLTYPNSSADAVNFEFAGAYHYDETGTVHASVSRRTRFPTVFELYSSRFGTFTGNPNLGPETGLNWEGGVSDTFGGLKLEANVFYSEVTDAIVAVSVNVPPVGVVSQDKNIGQETHKGIELAASGWVLPNLKLGANYTYMLRIDPNKTVVLTDTPNHKIYAYAQWQATDALSVVPSVEFESKRWLASTWVAGTYFRGGDHFVGNLKANYQFTDDLQAEIGINNIFDANYEFADAYHAPGRNFFTNIRAKF